MANILYMQINTHFFFLEETKEDILFLFILFPNENNFLIKIYCFQNRKDNSKTV